MEDDTICERTELFGYQNTAWVPVAFSWTPKQTGTLNPDVGLIIGSELFYLLYTRVMDCFVQFAEERGFCLPDLWKKNKDIYYC